jgi:16S rRNA (adenine1518-N6/adenine1519-N6)-dimethyltransferase|tara:strand:- start:481 stop:1248 length:768 start_codon:yes stop_codon:yes gene_type:complete
VIVRKRFGQHFLKDPNTIRRIVEAVSPRPIDHVIEIGPGHGAITDLLSTSRCRLQLVEIDRDLVAELSDRYGAEINILTADALKLDYGSLGNSLRIVGNLPYNISSPLLFKLYGYIEQIQDMVFMLQEEVVDRICATAGTKDYGRLSVMSQYYCSAEKLFKVAPSAFSPKPKVNSAIVKLTPHDHPQYAKDLQCLQEVVTTAFNQRRKTIRNSLKPLLNSEQLASLDIDTNLRPEVLELDEFINCANLLWELRQK